MYASIHRVFLGFDDRVEIVISIVRAHRTSRAALALNDDDDDDDDAGARWSIPVMRDASLGCGVHACGDECRRTAARARAPSLAPGTPNPLDGES